MDLFAGTGQKILVEHYDDDFEPTEEGKIIIGNK